jgi:hypothetical protein
MHNLSQNVTSKGTVREWCRMFKDLWTNVHIEEWSGRPSVVSDELVQSVDQKVCERLHCTISELSCEFPQISCTILSEIITVRLGYHKFCARWVLKMLTGVHKTQNGFGFDFFRVILWRWQWMSQSHCTSNRWWNLGSFTKQARKV